jgi:hypothetical protein
MTAKVLGPADIQNLSTLVPSDSVSKLYGDKLGFTFCGTRNFKIPTSQGVATFLSYDQSTYVLRLYSSNPAEVRTKSVNVQAYLEKYPAIFLEKTFLVTIEPCEITDISVNTTPDQFYHLFNPAVAKTIAVVAFNEDPLCGNGDIKYSFQQVLADGSKQTLPSFIKQSQPDGSDLVL